MILTTGEIVVAYVHFQVEWIDFHTKSGRHAMLLRVWRSGDLALFREQGYA